MNNAEGQVVLFFYAAWCPSCRKMDTTLISEQGKIPDGLTILKVDFDDSTELRQKYGVQIQHTLVQTDNQGNLLTKWNSLYSEYDLESILNHLL